MVGRARLLKLLPVQGRLPARYLYERTFRRFGDEVRYLRRHVRPGGVAVDAGAAVGLYSYAFTRMCRKVIAFEPNPASAAAILAHRHPAIEVRQAALSSKPGRATLFVPRDASGEHPSAATLVEKRGEGTELDVPLETLDSLDVRDLTILKIDVEGHEMDVIRGARETIARERPVMLIEIEQRHLHVPIRQVFDEILALGYRGFFLEGDREVPLESFDPAKHQDLGQGVLSREYVNDFLFLPKG